jgi:glycosyltransferase involved in cell wall biosynthesis
MSVSLCMIVRNEEQTLPRCLSSVAGLVDETIVVDTGSTDKTKAIAASLGARVFDFLWCDDFAAARNESIRHASGQWIFWLDADDLVDDENRARLRDLFSGLREDLTGYFMQCASVSPKGALQASHPHIRLFRNDPRVRWERRIHEQIISSIERHGGDLRKTDVVVRHLGYTGDSTVVQKALRNLRLCELECLDRPLDAYAQFCRGAALSVLGRYPESLIAFNLAASGPLPDLSRRKLYAEMARSYLREGSPSLAFESLEIGLFFFPDDPDLLFAEAQLRGAHGEYARAEECMRIVLSTQMDAKDDCSDASVAGPRGRHFLALACALQGKHEEAEHEIRRSIASDPKYGPAWIVLAESFAGRGQHDRVEALLSDAALPRSARTLLEVYLRAVSGDLAGAHHAVDEAEAGARDLGRAREWLEDVSGGRPARPIGLILSGKKLGLQSAAEPSAGPIASITSASSRTALYSVERRFRRGYL